MDMNETGSDACTRDGSPHSTQENKPTRRKRRDRQVRTNFVGGQFPTRLARFIPANTEGDPEFASIRDPLMSPYVWNLSNIVLPLQIQEEEQLLKEVLFKKQLLECEQKKLRYQKEMVVSHIEARTYTPESPGHIIKILLEKTDDPDDTTFTTQDASTTLSTTS